MLSWLEHPSTRRSAAIEAMNHLCRRGLEPVEIDRPDQLTLHLQVSGESHRDVLRGLRVDRRRRQVMPDLVDVDEPVELAPG